jgi:hypothetical protein
MERKGRKMKILGKIFPKKGKMNADQINTDRRRSEKTQKRKLRARVGRDSHNPWLAW